MKTNSSFMLDLSKEPRAAWALCGTERLALDRGLNWKARDIEVKTDRKIGSTAVTISAETSALSQIELQWELVLPTDVHLLGDHWERAYGDLEWRGIRHDRVMPWYCLAETNGKVAAVGVKTGGGALCSWLVTRDALRLCIDVRCGGEGVLLAGRKLFACEIVTDTAAPGESAYAFLRRFCGMLCDKPRMPSAPVYGGNNWYYAYANADEAQLRDDSAFISSLASDNANRPFMFIDDGWQLCRTGEFIGGPWHQGNSRFPDMPRLAEDMKREGVRPGLWIRPLQTAAYFPPAWRLPRQRFLSAQYGGESPYFLDPSIPEALAIIREDIARIASWGFDAIKHDYSTYDLFGRWGFDMLGGSITSPGWHFADRSRTSMEIVLDLYRTIREAAGDTLVLGCNTISHAGAGLFDMQRTGDDTSAEDWVRTRKMGVNAMSFRCAQHGAFYSADADCVGITEAIPWRLNSQWLELVSRSGTPLLVSVDPRKATGEHRTALSRAFAIAAQPQPLVEPLDWMYSPYPSEYILQGEKRRFRWDD